MRKCLIYDNNGNILMATTNLDEETLTSVGVVFADDIDGKMIRSVNPETGEPMYVDKPKTEIDLLKEKIITLQQGIIELSDVVISE